MANERQTAPQSDIKVLISKGLEQGYLTYAEVNDHLPDDMVDPEQIEDIIGMINGMGIEVHEIAPDAETLLLAGSSAGGREVDDTAAEEAAATLSALDAEGGRTTDPVRMYMREMGTVELLTREGEIAIAKRIEEGLNQMLSSLASSAGRWRCSRTTSCTRRARSSPRDRGRLQRRRGSRSAAGRGSVRRFGFGFRLGRRRRRRRRRGRGPDRPGSGRGRAPHGGAGRPVRQVPEDLRQGATSAEARC